jgi:twinkle protein
MEIQESQIVSAHKFCPECESSDAMSIYTDHTYCFSCLTWRSTLETADVIPMNVHKSLEDLTIRTTAKWEDRKISKAVTSFYDVIVSNGNVEFPYYDGTAKIASKFRNFGKEFKTTGEFSQAGMFGAHTLLKAKNFEVGNTVIITEGESDALAAFQIANKINPTSESLTLNKTLVPVFSIKSGVASAERDIKANLEMLEKFERIFVCFDSDEHGQKASRKVAKLFTPSKARIVTLELKDACEYTTKGWGDQFMAHLKDAPIYTPSGIENASNNFDRLWSEQNLISIDFPWKELNQKTLGIRQREIVTWAAGTGVGKSSFMRELQHFYIKNNDFNIGIIALEESVDRTRRGILAIEANDKLHLNEVFGKYSKEDIKGFFDPTLGTGKVYLYDHFGSMDCEDLINRVRYMVVGLDCKVIFIDHLSILVSGLDILDERKAIDKTMTLLRQLTQETECAIHLVAHLSRRSNSDKSHEDGGEINLAHLRGSHGISQVSDTVIALERDTQSDDQEEANTTTLRVLKCRYTGDLGIAGRLTYNKTNGRLQTTKDEF